MINMKKTIAISSVLGSLMAVSSVSATTTEELNNNNLKEMNDSLSALVGHLESSNNGNLFGPINFKGQYYSRYLGGSFSENPAYMDPWRDRAHIDGQLMLRMIANPNPFFSLSTMVALGYDYNGHYRNAKAQNAGTRSDDAVDTKTPLATFHTEEVRVRSNTSTEREGAGVFEELLVNADIKLPDFKFLVEAGSAIWVQQSPLTIWRRDPRHKSAWYYETYEPEMTSGGFYKQKEFIRNDWDGMSIWPRRTFGGVHTDVYHTPWGIDGQFLVAEPTYARPMMQRANMMSHFGDAEAIGSVSHPGRLYAFSINKPDVIDNLAIAFNGIFVNFEDNIINEKVQQTVPLGTSAKYFKYQFGADSASAYSLNPASGYYDQNPYIEEPRTLSTSFIGRTGGNYYWESDVGVSWNRVRTFEPVTLDKLKQTDFDDLNEIRAHYPNAFGYNEALTPDTYAASGAKIYDLRSNIKETSSKPGYAAYVRVYNNGMTPYQVEGIAATKEFYSPYSMTQNTLPNHKDRIKLGAGNSILQNNLIGATYTWMPRQEGGNGYFRIGAGAYSQISKGNDAIAFQYKLNGRDLWKLSNSWSRTEPDRGMYEGRPYNTANYNGRVGEVGRSRELFAQSQAGGQFGDDNELWEEFVVYQKDPQVITKEDGTIDSSRTLSYFSAPPQSQKQSWNLSFDWGKNFPSADKKTRFINSYAELNGVFAGSKNAMLSALAVVEPVWEISKSFYVVGPTVGAEYFNAPNAWRANLNPNTASGWRAEDPDVLINYYDQQTGIITQKMAIDYLDWSAGMGFDWDMTDRAGLHFRYKWFGHQDRAVNSEISKQKSTQYDLSVFGLAGEKKTYAEIQSAYESARASATTTGQKLKEFNAYGAALKQIGSIMESNDILGQSIYGEVKVWF